MDPVTMLLLVIAAMSAGVGGVAFLIAVILWRKHPQQIKAPTETELDQRLLDEVGAQEEEILGLVEGPEWDTLRQQLANVRIAILPRLQELRRGLRVDIRNLEARLPALRQGSGASPRMTRLAESDLARLRTALSETQRRIDNATAFFRMMFFRVTALSRLGPEDETVRARREADVERRQAWHTLLSQCTENIETPWMRGPASTYEQDPEPDNRIWTRGEIDRALNGHLVQAQVVVENEEDEGDPDTTVHRPGDKYARVYRQADQNRPQHPAAQLRRNTRREDMERVAYGSPDDPEDIQDPTTQNLLDITDEVEMEVREADKIRKELDERRRLERASKGRGTTQQ